MDEAIDAERLLDSLRAYAAELGFGQMGVATLHLVDTTHFKAWLEAGKQAGMSYLEKYTDLRGDPTLLLSGAQSIVVLTMPYYTGNLPDGIPRVARYAFGADYHRVLRRQMRLFDRRFRALFPDATTRITIDTAPIFERYWAEQAGVGFVGRNNLLIVPGEGSFCFLATLLTTITLPSDRPIGRQCGACRRCIEACPTGALASYDLDACRCIAYRTIEHRGEGFGDLPRVGHHGHLFGCDRCQEVCPHNRIPRCATWDDFRLSDAVAAITPAAIRQMDSTFFDTHFIHSPLRRAGLDGLRRNLDAID